MRRAFALLQAAWLSLLIAEPAALHACEMHAAGHGVHQPALNQDQHEQHAEHAHHDAAVADAAVADASTPAPDDAASSTCQCLGECCAAAVAALASASQVPAVAQIAATPRRFDAAQASAQRAPDLRLPHANGPPATLTT